jgi:hypothetical protein
MGPAHQGGRHICGLMVNTLELLRQLGNSAGNYREVTSFPIGNAPRKYACCPEQQLANVRLLISAPN